MSKFQRRVKADCKYEKRVRDQFHKLTLKYPEADPDFILENCRKHGKSPSRLNQFVSDIMDMHSYPRKKVVDEEYSQHEIDMEAMIKKYQDPIEHFRHFNGGVNYKAHSLWYLLIRFDEVSSLYIRRVFKKYNYSLYLTFMHCYSYAKHSLTNPRKLTERQLPRARGPQEFYDETFVIGYHSDFLFRRNARKAAIKKARAANELRACECCLADELFSSEVTACHQSHNFCNNCIKRSFEIKMSEGRYDVNCINECSETFPLDAIKNILGDKLFDILDLQMTRKAVAAAGIPGLENCPFCDYMAIVADGVQEFDCEGCKKTSCRECKEEGHYPMTCEEFLSEKMKRNSHIVLEERLSSTLIRKCWKCGIPILREDGCNKMTCLCGSHFCYICKCPVLGYAHFFDNDDPSTSDQKGCPLYTNNKVTHTDDVEKERFKAINELKRKNPDLDLEFPPEKK